MEVTALGVSVPRAAGVGIRSTESAGSTGVIAWTTGAARPAWVVTGAARPARTAGMIGARATRTTRTTGVITRRRTARTTGAAGVATGTTGPSRSARAAGIVGTGGSVAATGRRPAVITRRLWRSGRSVGKPGAHAQGRSAERSGDGHPSDKLLQLHDASPIH
ncbi:hypothetical protein A5659_18735 [Mycobacterium sp. 1165196.3]|nr:hypothetical protein A5624_02745 [Mycobacterium sp. 1482292.6]OBK36353.1 hypothetical protein A5659_18735 [Mycobacterium sp. 1165196.3]